MLTPAQPTVSHAAQETAFGFWVWCLFAGAIWWFDETWTSLLFLGKTTVTQVTTRIMCFFSFQACFKACLMVANRCFISHSTETHGLEIHVPHFCLWDWPPSSPFQQYLPLTKLLDLVLQDMNFPAALAITLGGNWTSPATWWLIPVVQPRGSMGVTPKSSWLSTVT